MTNWGATAASRLLYLRRTANSIATPDTHVWNLWWFTFSRAYSKLTFTHTQTILRSSKEPRRPARRQQPAVIANYCNTLSACMTICWQCLTAAFLCFPKWHRENDCLVSPLQIIPNYGLWDFDLTDQNHIPCWYAVPRMKHQSDPFPKRRNVKWVFLNVLCALVSLCVCVLCIFSFQSST